MKKDDFWQYYADDVYLLEAKRKWEQDEELALHRSDFRSFGRGVVWVCAITAVIATAAIIIACLR